MAAVVRRSACHPRARSGASVLAAGLAGIALALTACAQGSGPASASSPAGPSTAAPPASATVPPSTSPSPTAASSPGRSGTPVPSARPSRTTPATSAPARPLPFPSSLTGQDVERIPTLRRVVALTFDAGGDARGLDAILATLAREHVPATFFLTGRWVTDDPARVGRIIRAGHRIGNHTTGHPELTALGDAAVRAQIQGAQQTILHAGADPRPLFRFPFGDADARTIRLVNALGYVAVRWTVDSLGWQGTTGGRSAATVTQRVLAAARPGEIVLMHVGSNPDDHSTLDAGALPAVIAGLRAAGYRFVTLDALLTTE